VDRGGEISNPLTHRFLVISYSPPKLLIGFRLLAWGSPRSVDDLSLRKLSWYSRSPCAAFGHQFPVFSPSLPQPSVVNKRAREHARSCLSASEELPHDPIGLSDERTTKDKSPRKRTRRFFLDGFSRKIEQLLSEPYDYTEAAAAVRKRMRTATLSSFEAVTLFFFFRRPRR